MRAVRNFAAPWASLGRRDWTGESCCPGLNRGTLPRLEWGRIASVIETCKMNSVEPYAWLKTTLEKIAAGHPNSRIDELLPWNFKPPSS